MSGHPSSAAAADPSLVGGERFFDAVRALNATGLDAPREIDEPLERAMDAADDALVEAPATTLDGVFFKLKRALLMAAHLRWVEEALLAGDDAMLVARAEELGAQGRLIADAINGLRVLRLAAA